MAKRGRKPKAVREKRVKFPPGLTVTDLASRLAVSYPTARKWALLNDYTPGRSRLGRKPKAVPKKNAKVPPELSIGALARELDVSWATAKKWALLNKYGVGKRGRRRKPTKDLAAHNPPWKGVDWSLRDAEIARRLGKSRERVRQVRLQLGT